MPEAYYRLRSLVTLARSTCGEANGSGRCLVEDLDRAEIFGDREELADASFEGALVEAV